MLVAGHEKAPWEGSFVVVVMEPSSDAVADPPIAEFGGFLWFEGGVVGIDVFDAAIGLRHQALRILQSGLLAHVVAGDFEAVHG